MEGNYLTSGDLALMESRRYYGAETITVTVTEREWLQRESVLQQVWEEVHSLVSSLSLVVSTTLQRQGRRLLKTKKSRLDGSITTKGNNIRLGR